MLNLLRNVPWLLVGQVMVLIVVPAVVAKLVTATDDLQAHERVVWVLGTVALTFFALVNMHAFYGLYYESQPTPDQMRSRTRGWLDKAGYTLTPDRPGDDLDFRFVASNDARRFIIAKRKGSSQLVLAMNITVDEDQKVALRALSGENQLMVRLRLAASLGQLDLDFEVPAPDDGVLASIVLSDGRLVADNTLSSQLFFDRLGALARGHVVVSTAIALALEELSRQSAR